MSRERNVDEIIQEIISSDIEQQSKLAYALVRRFNPGGNPTEDYIAFLWSIVQQLEHFNDNQLNKIQSFLTICETGDAGAPITGIIDKKRYRSFARVFSDYSEIVERIFQNNDDLLLRIFGKEPYTLSNSVILFMIQKIREKPMCQYGKQCYRKNPQHFINFQHPKGGKTRKRRRLHRNKTKLRKRHRNL